MKNKAFVKWLLQSLASGKKYCQMSLSYNTTSKLKLFLRMGDLRLHWDYISHVSISIVSLEPLRNIYDRVRQTYRSPFVSLENISVLDSSYSGILFVISRENLQNNLENFHVAFVYCLASMPKWSRSVTALSN